MLPRAYSLLEIKSVDAEQRIIEGFASTPTLDRGGDVMDPAGARFILPMPLLRGHDHSQPLGEVFEARVMPKGIYIRARIEKDILPYIAEAWVQIKAGLVKGLSIGWRALERPEIKDGARRYSSWEWFETSAVVVPMNSTTTITLVKSIDDATLAALGTRTHITHPPGVSGLPKTGAVMTSSPISQQVQTVQTELAEKSTALEALNTKDLDEGGLSADETTELSALMISVKSLTERVDRLKTLEASQAARGQMVIARPTFTQTQQVTQTTSQTRVELATLPKGTGFTRYAMAVAAGRGSYSDTLAYAKRWEGQTPEVVQYVKAMFGQKAIEGTAGAGSPSWGSELAFQNNLASEFIELLRAATVIGRISGFRNVPFNVRIPRQTEGAVVNWVGESEPKPVGELAFDTVLLGYNKIAGIVVLTEELVRLSSPSAEETCRRDLIEGIQRFMDRQFLDPTITATSNRPASITNGVTSPAASGTTAEDLYFDLNLALATFDSSEVSTSTITIVMTPALARGISTLRNALGQFEFPGMSMMGGSLLGFPVVVSSSAPAGHIILIAAGEIFLADDGRVAIDASKDATLDMSGGSSPNFSLWQKDCIGLRAERWVTWEKRREESVAVIDTASYGPTAPAS